MNIKGNWRRAQRLENNRNRTKEEIREAEATEREKLSGVPITLNVNIV